MASLIGSEATLHLQVCEHRHAIKGYLSSTVFTQLLQVCIWFLSSRQLGSIYKYCINIAYGLTWSPKCSVLPVLPVQCTVQDGY